MLRSIKDLMGYPVSAKDGKAGKVKDVLFGDLHWRVRYLDVETRRGLHLNLRYLSKDESEDDQVTRRLIERKHLGLPQLGIDRREIPTDLTVDEVSKCEGFGSHLSAEEKYEMEFRRFFRHAIYDERPLFGSFGISGYMPPVTAYEHSDKEIRSHLDRMGELAGEHLHSAKAVIGYHVVGKEETLGLVGDLILDAENWEIAYLVLDTRHGIPSRKYLVDMDQVTRLDWSSSSMETALRAKDLLPMRRYWVYDPVNKDSTDHEYDYSGKPCLRSLMEDVF
ncbi:hypothetical protein [Pelagicoccus sp. SDUM812002]|uniref:hypothetical protein n=1 Tax=Pelagicoccus sp. SDUM812002 TaxID=3041266 RepID=UPI00280EE87A|nr:hypothetical protein [Pelagicoccus sp. SDUM812002]MDQ8185561.1 hypothetical protein [Pelagicoccus sp. SDUM812002]